MSSLFHFFVKMLTNPLRVWIRSSSIETHSGFLTYGYSWSLGGQVDYSVLLKMEVSDHSGVMSMGHFLMFYFPTLLYASLKWNLL